MNLEEAQNNIGAEVELDESTKPYTFIDDGEVIKAEFSIIKGSMKIFSCRNDGNVVVVSDNGVVKEWYLPKHLKLKPQNYKIHVPTEEESREAQELFFELGYEWMNSEKHVQHTDIPYLYSYSDEMKIAMGWGKELFDKHKNKQITLQNLRDMVSKKRMKEFDEKQKLVCSPISVSDIAEQVMGMALKSIGVDLASGEDKAVEIEMTWQDAFQALIDGKEVQMLDIHNQWENIKEFYLHEIMEKGNKFRLAPQRITLNGSFTKEELLQKAGEME